MLLDALLNELQNFKHWQAVYYFVIILGMVIKFSNSKPPGRKMVSGSSQINLQVKYKVQMKVLKCKF